MLAPLGESFYKGRVTNELVALRPRKRLFLGLALTSLLVTAFTIYGAWRISFPGLSQIRRYLPFAIGIVLVAVVVALGLGWALVLLAVLGLPTLAIAQRLAWWAVNLLFPIATVVGKLFDINRERIERSFIEVSNHLVRGKALRVPPRKLLVLTPHCLQLDVCVHKITRKVSNCKQCGNCQVGDLLRLSETYGFHLAIVPGGTLARQVIKTVRPMAVLAVACERDLVSGIQDVFPLPVIGVLNERPHGPCCNTRVDVERVEKVVRQLVGQA